MFQQKTQKAILPGSQLAFFSDVIFSKYKYYGDKWIR